MSSGEDMERRLAEYRAKKKKPETPTTLPEKTSLNRNNHNNEELPLNAKEDICEKPSSPSKLPEFIASSTLGKCFAGNKHLLSVTLGLKILLWIILWGFFIELEFGSVFFVISLFYGIYTTMRTRPRLPDEPSAYSVFNPNCERIDGTFTAEQFERELLGGAGLIH